MNRMRLLPYALVLLGAAIAVYGVFATPDRTWPNLLLDGFYMTSLAVSGMFFIASTRMTSARWSASLRRIPEALMLGLPVAAGLLLMVLVSPAGRHTLYSWSRPGTFAHEPAIAGKVQYLQTPFVLARVAVVLALWVLFAWLFRRASLRQDRNRRASLTQHHRLNRYAAAFIVVFAFSFTAGAYDWLISLDPSWFSTMFGVYVFAGTLVQGLAAITLAAAILTQRRAPPELGTPHQFHDLGKLLFAFSIFWAYIWTCQYLLIWYGNIPDEVTHYLKRTNGWWLPLFVANFVINWTVPFLALLSAGAKRRLGLLKGVTVALLVGHWLDLYLLITPALWTGPRLGIPEVGIGAGYAALFYLLFVRNLAKAPLVPVNDPILNADAAAHHHAEALSS
jgi:hypothetical protein